MGSGAEYVKRIAKEVAQEAIGKYRSIISGSNNDPRWFIGKVSSDKTTITHPNGTQFSLLFTGQVQDYNVAYIVSSDLAYAVGSAALKQIKIDGAQGKLWILIGGNLVETIQPEFNLVSTTDFVCYRIPKELLPNLYTGDDGSWTASLSPDAKTITLVRVRQSASFRTVTVPNPYLGLVSGIPGGSGAIGSTMTKNYIDAEVDYAILTNFTLDKEHNVIKDPTIVSGIRSYLYNGGEGDINTIPDPKVDFYMGISGGGLVEGSNNLGNYTDCDTTTYTWLGWIVGPTSFNFLSPGVIINYNGNTPIVDIVGYWTNETSAFPAWHQVRIENDSIPIGPLNTVSSLAKSCISGVSTVVYNSLTHNSVQTDQGSWIYKDIVGSNTYLGIDTSHNPHSLDIGYTGFNFSRPDYSARGGNFSLLAYRNGSNTSDGTTDIVKNVISNVNNLNYYNTPYATVVNSVKASIDTSFAIDSVRKYTDFNSVTKWIDNSALVKVTDIGTFLDFNDQANEAKNIQSKQWTYSSDTFSIVLSKTTTTPTYPLDFGVFTLSSGVDQNFVIIDWQLQK